MKKERGYPRVEKTERTSQDENIIDGMVDEIGKAGSNGIRKATDEGGEPFGEGTNIRTEEGVEGVGEGVVGAESAVADGRQSQARPHRVHHVRTRSWHGADATTSKSNFTSEDQDSSTPQEEREMEMEMEMEGGSFVCLTQPQVS